MLILFQLALFVILAVFAYWAWPACSPLLRRFHRGFCWLARRQNLAIVVVALFAVGCSIFLSAAQGLPQPIGRDEFSYLLAADTFAHGRLTNPAHPLWEHFETHHVIVQPSYASKYPPGQGLALAAGKVLFGHPIVGVWLSIGLCCAAICWMLQAWLPSRWALAGALLAAFHLTLFGGIGQISLPGYWSQSYWGGAVAASGGALLFGALRRLIMEPKASHAAVLAFGLAVLANSRPFEGFVVSIPAAILLFGWLISNRRNLGLRTLSHVIAPILLVLAPTGGAMLYYNYRVTGNALRSPYVEFQQQYAVAPLFVWQDARPEPNYRHPPIRDVHVGFELAWYEDERSTVGWLIAVFSKAVRVSLFYLIGFVLILPILGWHWIVRDRWMRFVVGTCGTLGLGLAMATYTLPHYAAPVTCLIYVLVAQGLRRIRLWRWGSLKFGKSLLAAIPVVCLATLFYSFLDGSRVPKMAPFSHRSLSLQRARIVSQLCQDGDQHLILVRYPQVTAYDPWIYNDAEIDAARVVWAREMDRDHNLMLLDYFHNRQVWLLDANTDPAKLLPYPEVYAHARTAVNSSTLNRKESGR